MTKWNEMTQFDHKFFNHELSNEENFINQLDANEHYEYLETYKFQEPVEVTTIDLDGYLIKHNILEKISFIKIDVDGPELIVLQSAKKVLQNPNLIILMEWDQGSAKWSDCDPASIIDILSENGFEIYLM